MEFNCVGFTTNMDPKMDLEEFGRKGAEDGICAWRQKVLTLPRAQVAWAVLRNAHLRLRLKWLLLTSRD